MFFFGLRGNLLRPFVLSFTGGIFETSFYVFKATFFPFPVWKKCKFYKCWSGIKILFLDIFPSGFWKRHSTCQEEQFEGKKFHKKYFYTIYGKWVNFFSSSDQKFFARVVKNSSFLPRGTIWGKKFLKKIDNFFCHILPLIKIVSLSWLKNLLRGLQNCLLCVRKISLKEMIFFRKEVFLKHLLTLSKKFWLSVQTFSIKYYRWHSTCSVDPFGELSKRAYFQIFLDIEQKCVGLPCEDLSVGRSELHYRCPDGSFQDSVQENVIFINFGHRWKYFRHFDMKVSTGLWKLPSTCTEEKYGETHCFWKKVILIVCGHWWKYFETLAGILRWGCK